MRRRNMPERRHCGTGELAMGSDGMTTWQKIRVLLAIVFVMVASLFLVAHTTNQSNAAVAQPKIPSGQGFDFTNYDYGNGIAWIESANCTNGVAGAVIYANTITSTCGGTFWKATAGTNQAYQYYNASGDFTGLCAGYDNTYDRIRFQTCNGATYQQWRSENTSHGWLIYSVWFMNAYPNWCASVGYSGYEAVATVDAPDTGLRLACPEGYTGNGAPWGLGQWWAAVTFPQ